MKNATLAAGFLSIAMCNAAIAQDTAAAGVSAAASAPDTPPAAVLALDAALLDTVAQTVYTEDAAPVSSAEMSTAEALRNTGRQLAATGDAGGKYLAAQYTSGGRRRADIIYISGNANVTTAKCLFLIVAGYLEAATSPSPVPAEGQGTLAMKDAAAAYTLAEQICWWNTAHYADTAYFNSLIGETGNAQGNPSLPFSDRTQSIGLSASYKDWPGGTRIVIPWASPSASTTAIGGNSTVVVDDSLVSNTVINESAPAEPQLETAHYRPKDEYTAESNIAERLSVPNGFMIMLAAVSLAIVMLVMLLIKVIMDLSRDRGQL